MTEERQRQLLGIYVRNHMSGPGAIFSPFDGLDLSYNQEGTLCKVAPGTNYGETTQIPLIHQSLLFGASDEQMWGAVMEGKPIVHDGPELELVLANEKKPAMRKKR
jgi:hypothetical protein